MAVFGAATQERIKAKKAAGEKIAAKKGKKRHAAGSAFLQTMFAP
jgi:hypothetical protein